MNNHLDHQQMLAYLDGELSRRETQKADEHLHSCWTCRTEVERLKTDIATILDAQNESFSPAMPPPPGPWPAFNTLLVRNLPAQSVSLWMRLAASMNALLTPPRVLVMSVAIAGVLVGAYSIFRTPVVSAKEVLRRIQVADTTRSAIAANEVIRERVHIRRTTRDDRRQQSAIVNTWKSQKTSYWETPNNDSVTSDLEAQYRAHDVPVSLPLSAASADAWGRVMGGAPTVTQQGSDIDLSFAGSTGGATGSVDRVDVLIQPQTWQVKQLTLAFADASFEVTEENFDVMSATQVPSDLLAHLDLLPAPQEVAESVAHPIPRLAVNAIHLPPVNLDAAELVVLSTLHQMKADLGEPVTVTRSSRDIQVGVWQLPNDRQNEVREALADKPGVQVMLAAPHNLQRGDAVAREMAPPPTLPAGGPIRVDADSEDEDQRLLKFFGSPEKEQAFTSQTLATSTTILSHLYALRNLEVQFPAEKEQGLGAVEDAQLSALIEDHTSAIEDSLGTLSTQLAPLNREFKVVPSDQSAEATVTNWQSASLDALETARIADHLLRSVFTTSQTPTAPDVALPLIDQNLSRLSAEVASLRPKTH
jgi:hypothetical protein